MTKDPAPLMSPDPEKNKPTAADIEADVRFRDRQRKWVLWCRAVVAVSDAKPERLQRVLARATGRYKPRTDGKDEAAMLLKAIEEGRVHPEEARGLAGWGDVCAKMITPLQLQVCREHQRCQSLAEHAAAEGAKWPASAHISMQAATDLMKRFAAPHSVACQLVQLAVKAGTGTITRPMHARSLIVVGPDPIDISYSKILEAFTAEAMRQTSDIYEVMGVQLG